MVFYGKTGSCHGNSVRAFHRPPKKKFQSTFNSPPLAGHLGVFPRPSRGEHPTTASCLDLGFVVKSRRKPFFRGWFWFLTGEKKKWVGARFAKFPKLFFRGHVRGKKKPGGRLSPAVGLWGGSLSFLPKQPFFFFFSFFLLENSVCKLFG